MNEEGVIKFKSTWIRKNALDESLIHDLNNCRQHLYQLSLIGCTIDGIGYGNISKRFTGNSFIISGSGTGNIRVTDHQHYTLVTSFDIEGNSLVAEGPVMASSESLTHAMLYQCDKDVQAVIHIHHHALWERLMSVLPGTEKNVAYGTPAMALEIKRIYNLNQIRQQKIFAMGGHQDGIIAFGESLAAVEKIITGQLARV